MSKPPLFFRQNWKKSLEKVRPRVVHKKLRFLSGLLFFSDLHVAVQEMLNISCGITVFSAVRGANLRRLSLSKPSGSRQFFDLLFIFRQLITKIRNWGVNKKRERTFHILSLFNMESLSACLYLQGVWMFENKSFQRPESQPKTFKLSIFPAHYFSPILFFYDFLGK